MSIIDLVTFVLVLGIIIFVHELGHLIYAKKYNVYCYEFAIGMGPVIYSKQKGETKYSIRAIPIGGFVTMAGEDDEGNEIANGRRLFDISKYKQAMIMFAGAFFNFILGITIILIVGFIVGVPTNSAKIGTISDNSVASDIGLEVGDEIISVNGNEVDSYTEFVDLANTAKADGSIEVVFDHSGEEIIFSSDDVNEEFLFGITNDVTRNPFVVLKNTFVTFYKLSVAVVAGFIQLITNFGEVSKQVSGPVGIYNYVGEARSLGIISLAMITAMLSINIGILNLMPFPALDGSKIVIAVVEGITKRDLPRKVHMIISLVGFVVLISFMVFITILDIRKL